MTMSRLMAEGLERGNIRLRERERKEVGMITRCDRVIPFEEFMEGNP